MTYTVVITNIIGGEREALVIPGCTFDEVSAAISDCMANNLDPNRHGYLILNYTPDVPKIDYIARKPGALVMKNRGVCA